MAVEIERMSKLNLNVQSGSDIPVSFVTSFHLSVSVPVDRLLIGDLDVHSSKFLSCSFVPNLVYDGRRDSYILILLTVRNR